MNWPWHDYPVSLSRMNETTEPLRYRKSIFECADKAYPGYTSGGSWNGFETPCFDHKTAASIRADCVANPEYTSCKEFSYDSSTDTFRLVSNLHGEDEVEEFTGQTIVTDIGAIRVYSIGAYSWTWTDTLPDIISEAFIAVWGEQLHREEIKARTPFAVWLNLFVGPEPEVDIRQFSSCDQAYDLIRQRGFCEPLIGEFFRLVATEINSK